MTADSPLVIKETGVIEFATEHYEEPAPSTGSWNSRQIRSAFQIASSLALHNYAKQTEIPRCRGQIPPAATVLGRTLFGKVQMSTQCFEKHMTTESSTYDMALPLRGSFTTEC